MNLGKPNVLALAVLLISFTSCIETQSSQATDDSEYVPPNEQIISSADNQQITSLFGMVLPPKQLSSAQRAEREIFLQQAQSSYENEPNNPEKIIWYGRALGFVGAYVDAIEIFSAGVNLYPESYKLLSHRGHRYITIRKFDEAIEDLQEAAFYSRTVQNEIEHDGIPSTDLQAITNTKFNIWYRLGVAYYLKGNYDKAISSFKKSQLFTENEDLIVVNTDWFYMTYRKSGNLTAASKLLEKISAKMNLAQNQEHLKRLLLFKGELSVNALLQASIAPDSSLTPTMGYGVGNWYLFNGKADSARMVYEKILKSPDWDSFSYIAAEADLHAFVIL